ncbi:MAG TPA: hypothetical protein VNZ52_16260 [Candidatus Thermoplasmatota archaeon]|nr:hypothetical protein [Candidatus Thermoplasmatota archaeon]
MEASPRPLLGAGTLALPLAVAALAAALLLPDLLPVSLGLVLLGWFHLTACGLLVFYQPAFSKRAPPPAALAYFVLVLPAAALAAALLAGPLRLDAPRVPLQVTALAVLAAVLVFGGAALLGSRSATRLPLHRNGSPYEAGDRAVVLAYLLALVTAAGGAALLLRDPALGSPGLLLLATGPPALILMMAGYHLFPRVAKRALESATIPVLATLLVAAGSLGLAVGATVGLPESTRPVYAAAYGIGLLHLAIITLTAFLRIPETAGPQSRAAKPLSLASVPFLVAGALVLPLSGQGHAEVAYLFLGGAGSLLFLAHTYLLFPIIANQVPWDRRVPLGVAALLALATPLAVLAFVLGLPVWPPVLLAAVAALLHFGNLLPLARPRRECPPTPDGTV